MDRKEAIDIVRNNWPDGRHQLSEALETLIPELKKSKYEMMREMAIKAVHAPQAQDCIRTWGVNPEDVIAWLEKLDEQKPDAKAEPKFKVGDWVVYDGWVTQILQVCQDGYVNIHHGFIPKEREEIMHLWTIQDAKEGDVLANKYGSVLIYAGFEDDERVTVDNYCYITANHYEFCIEDHKTGSWYYIEDLNPATKEQRDLLFQKMKEAGYEWDSEKKELKKIEQKLTWSEEDENRFRNLIYLVEHSDEGKGTKEGFVEFINRLKSKIIK